MDFAAKKTKGGIKHWKSQHTNASTKLVAQCRRGHAKSQRATARERRKTLENE